MAGGQHLLKQLGVARGAVVDLGQTAAKVQVGAHRQRHPRDWTRIPRSPADLAAAQDALRAWLVGLLRGLGPLDALVLGLPCELGADGALGPCTWPWADGDDRLIPTILAEAGLQDVPALLLNDAELAAASAALDPRCAHGTTLVLTLGFGVGGAVLSAP